MRIWLQTIFCLAILGILSISPANAGQLFPPSGANVVIGPGNTNCPANKKLLMWNGDSVLCASPQDAVDMTCATGQALRGFNPDGSKICITVPTDGDGSGSDALPAATCGANRIPVWTGSTWSCTSISIPACSPYKVPVWAGSGWTCSTIPASSCTATQAPKWTGSGWNCVNINFPDAPTPTITLEDMPSGTYAGGFVILDESPWTIQAIEPVFCEGGGNCRHPKCRPGWKLIQMEDAMDDYTQRQDGFMCRKI